MNEWMYACIRIKAIPDLTYVGGSLIWAASFSLLPPSLALVVDDLDCCTGDTIKDEPSLLSSWEEEDSVWLWDMTAHGRRVCCAADVELVCDWDFPFAFSAAVLPVCDVIMSACSGLPRMKLATETRKSPSTTAFTECDSWDDVELSRSSILQVLVHTCMHAYEKKKRKK